MMQEAVNKEPLHWGAWLELSSLCTDKEVVSPLMSNLKQTVPDFIIKSYSPHLDFRTI